MLSFGWVQVLLAVSSIGRTALSEEEGGEILHGLNQVEVERILNFQTSLRRNLIRSLSKVRETTAQSDGLRSVAHEIIRGLQTRDLDPFEYLEDGNRTTRTRMAEIIGILLGGTALAGLSSDAQRLSDSPPPEPLHLRKVMRAGRPFVELVLCGIQEKSLKVSGRLFADVLRNFRFEDHSADLEVIAEGISQMVEGGFEEFSGFHPEETSFEGPHDVLSAILNFLIRKRPEPRLVYQVGRLLSALPQVENLKKEPEPWGLFDLMLLDDYPQDVIQAKNALSLGVRSGRFGRVLWEVDERLQGRSPTERLLMMVAKLTSLPRGDPLSKKALAVYPHLRLRYLSAAGKFFRARSLSDVVFLLDSFLTAPTGMSPGLLREIQRIFFLQDFDWKEVLENFDYSRYSKPRPLALAMVQTLLSNSTKLPPCGVIAFNYFLEKNIEDPPRVLLEKNILHQGPRDDPPDIEERSHPTTDPSKPFFSPLGTSQNYSEPFPPASLETSHLPSSPAPPTDESPVSPSSQDSTDSTPPTYPLLYSPDTPLNSTAQYVASTLHSESQETPLPLITPSPFLLKFPEILSSSPLSPTPRFISSESTTFVSVEKTTPLAKSSLTQPESTTGMLPSVSEDSESSFTSETTSFPGTEDPPVGMPNSSA